MPTVTIGPISGGSTPSYVAHDGRGVSGSGETWSTLLNGAGTSGSGSFGGVASIWNTEAYTSYGYFNGLYGTDLVIDYRDYMHLNVTAAYFEIVCVANLATPLVYPWTTDTLNGFSWTLQDETTRGINWQAGTTWQECIDGAVGGTQITTLVPFSSLPTSYTATQWHFNSAGLAYLNSIRSKTYNPGYLFATGQWGGVIYNVEPLFPYPPSKLATSMHLYVQDPKQINLVLTYSGSNPTIGVPIGSTQKAVSGMKVNISNVWKDVVESKVQVGGAWKDVT